MSAPRCGACGKFFKTECPHDEFCSLNCDMEARRQDVEVYGYDRRKREYEDQRKRIKALREEQ